MKIKLKIALTTICAITMGLTGCALVNHTMLEPAADYAKVQPLFRSAECQSWIENHANSNNAKWNGWFGFFDVYHNIFAPHQCEDQFASVPATVNKPSNDGKNTDTVDMASVTVCNETGQNKANRNSCVAYLLAESDKICAIHKASIQSNRVVGNTVLGILAAGAGAAGGGVPGLAAAKALSLSAGFLTGAGSMINEEVYRNQLTTAIIKEIDTNRAAEESSISQHKSNPYEGFTLQEAMREVQKYHDKCSFYDALASLLNKAGDNGNAKSSMCALVERVEELKAEEDKKANEETAVCNAGESQKKQCELKSREKVELVQIRHGIESSLMLYPKSAREECKKANQTSSTEPKKDPQNTSGNSSDKSSNPTNGDEQKKSGAIDADKKI
jgi:hypothetical protein